MSQYSSQPVNVHRPIDVLASKFSDFTALETNLRELDETERAKVSDVKFTADTICISTPQVGEIRLKAVERSRERLVLKAEQSPVPLQLEVLLKEVDPETTSVQGVIDVDLPLMLRPLIGPTLQKAADQFGSLFGKLA